MTFKLDADDRRAVDLLLDRTSAAAARNGNGNGNGNGHGSHGTFSEVSVDHERLASAERVLRMLDLLPASDPPDDLVERTMRRVGTTDAASLPAMQLFGQPIGGSQQAHA